MSVESKVPEIRFEGFSGAWEEKELGVLSQVIDPHPSHRAPDEVTRGVPFIGIGDISEDGEIDYSNVRTVSHHIYDEHRRRYTLNEGDFAYGRVASIGKIIDLSKNVLSKYTYSPTMALVKPISVDSDYLKSYLHTETFKNNVDNKTTGSTRKSLGVQAFRNLPIFFPEDMEQTKIGNYFQQLDTLIAQHQDKHEKLLQIKKSLLEKMFPKQGGMKPEIRFKGFSEPWEERALGDLGSVAMNKRIFKDQTSDKGDIPFFKIGTFGSKPDAFISKELFDKYKSKYPFPEVGDLLISASGSIGRIVEYTGDDQYFQDSNIVWLKHDEQVENTFLKVFYSIVKWSGLEGSTIKRLYNKNILETQISIPTPEEQTKIGKLFKNLDTLLSQHQSQLNKLKQIKQACLAKMFV